MRMPAIPACTLAMVLALAAIGSAGCRHASSPAGSSTASVSEADRPRGQATNLRNDDIRRKARLEEGGEVLAGENVVLWFPRGAIAPEEAAKLLDEYQRGIVAAKKKIGKPDWNHQGDRRVYYYLPDADFISHASNGNCTFIPLWRVQERQAPWLHEALHLLLNVDQGDGPRQKMPLWLHEGLADAVAIDVSQAEGLEYFSPMMDVPVDQLDALAARALRAAPSPEVLATIGGPGRLQELFGPERRKFAVPFYNGSASFVRFLVNRLGGYRPLLAAIGDLGREHEALEREAGESLASMKAAWLEKIAY